MTPVDLLLGFFFLDMASWVGVVGLTISKIIACMLYLKRKITLCRLLTYSFLVKTLKDLFLH